MNNIFTWARKGGYECSSKGDKRFSAFYARMPDGRTIESHYQCDVKGYNPGGSNWKLGKGKPSLLHENHEDLYKDYLNLWEIWARDNLDYMRDLYIQARKHDNVLSDCFAHSDINQARALSDILNKLCNKEK